jgi:hypothetical protein
MKAGKPRKVTGTGSTSQGPQETSLQLTVRDEQEIEELVELVELAAEIPQPEGDA